MKKLHPALAARAAAVKTAHAHLSKTVPGFRAKSGREQIAHAQAHVSKTLKAGTQATPRKGGY